MVLQVIAGWDMVAGTIQPMIRGHRLVPDLVVASNADIDHAGGLERLHTMYPEAGYLASLPAQTCRYPRLQGTGDMAD